MIAQLFKIEVNQPITGYIFKDLNGEETVSEKATVTVSAQLPAAPTVTQAPERAYLMFGQKTTLSVYADAPQGNSVKYQWYSTETNDPATATAIPDATTAEFVPPEKDGTVYYRTRQFREYGKLSHKNLDDLRSGARSLLVTGEDQKEDPLDFVLWKPKKEGEPFWESPWCEGRPGWHIECSVMSRKYAGSTLDIHGGGEDLIFPHHENEIAQSEAANGETFANYWMHNAFLNIDNHKMSKSLGNFFTVRDIVAQYDPQVVRYFMLNVQYRSPLNFSRELMESGRAAYERICNCASNLDYLLTKKSAKVEKLTAGESIPSPQAGQVSAAPAVLPSGTEVPVAVTAKEAQKLMTPGGIVSASDGLSDEESRLLTEADAYRKKFESVMDDDFNTADGIATIFDLVKWINSNADENSSAAFLAVLRAELHTLAGILGLKAALDRPGEEEDADLASYVEDKIAERQAARKARDFGKADAIRDELKAKGIILEDTRDGVKWKKA